MNRLALPSLSGLLLASILLLPGCATLSKDECRNGDWQAIGLRDGLAGQSASRIVKHREACAEYNVAPDETKYRLGREEGLREYCEIRNAFRTGLDGHKYEGVCPPSMDSSFRRYNDAAYEVYRLRKEIDQVEDRIYDKERLLDEKRDKKKDRKLTEEERDRLRDDIRELDRRRDRLRDDLRRADIDLDRMMDDARRGNRDWR